MTSLQTALNTAVDTLAIVNRTLKNDPISDLFYTTTDEGMNVVNETLIMGNEFMMKGYPSGYNTAEVYIISSATVIIMMGIIIGNLLVIIAIFFEYSLQCVQNWFVASLALADLAVGVLIMPFSLSQEVVGYWLFGEAWCQIHQSLDVLFCTASILNITLISLDRYWSITSAVKVNYTFIPYSLYLSTQSHEQYVIVIFVENLISVCSISDRKISSYYDLYGVVFECSRVITYASLSSLANPFC